MTEAAVAETKPPSVAQQLLHSTVRIECIDSKGHQSSGTGFHFRFKFGEELVAAIITNRHVFDGAASAGFYVTMADADGRATSEHMRIDIGAFGPAWIGHPDASVDLAMLPIQPILSAIEQSNRRAFYIDLNEGTIATPEMLSSLTAIEDVTMIGYPNGIWDHVNNLPIVRRGVTATPCYSKYQGREEFLIDAACFPGSSGSPVFVFNEGTYVTPAGVTFGTRLMLVGVLFAGHLHTAEGEIKVVTIPTATSAIALSQIPNNLGLCISARRILDFKVPLMARIAAETTRTH